MESKTIEAHKIKIKVTEAEIVVHGTADKPYYEIKYFDIADQRYHIGYSSYDLNFVFQWLEECFEVVNTNRQVAVREEL